jgi:hypothetical protein
MNAISEHRWLPPLPVLIAIGWVVLTSLAFSIIRVLW